jgi:hypothetical protein
MPDPTELDALASEVERLRAQRLTTQAELRGRPISQRPGTPRCSFCGRERSERRRVVAGPGVFICVECLDLCNEVLERDRQVMSRYVKANAMRRVWAALKPRRN